MSLATSAAAALDTQLVVADLDIQIAEPPVFATQQKKVNVVAGIVAHVLEAPELVLEPVHLDLLVQQQKLKSAGIALKALEALELTALDVLILSKPATSAAAALDTQLVVAKLAIQIAVLRVPVTQLKNLIVEHGLNGAPVLAQLVHKQELAHVLAHLDLRVQQHKQNLAGIVHKALAELELTVLDVPLQFSLATSAAAALDTQLVVADLDIQIAEPPVFATQQKKVNVVAGIVAHVLEAPELVLEPVHLDLLVQQQKLKSAGIALKALEALELTALDVLILSKPATSAAAALDTQLVVAKLAIQIAVLRVPVTQLKNLTVAPGQPGVLVLDLHQQELAQEHVHLDLLA